MVGILHLFFVNKNMIKLIKSSFYNELETKKKLSEFILNSDRFSMGDYCQKFEKKFSIKQQIKFSVFVSSGSMANLVLIQSLINLGRIKKNDVVAVSSVTWATNVMPIIQLGLQPIAIDCELNNLNISCDILKQKYEKTPFSVLFLTNVLGFCGDIDRIKDFCDKKDILLIEDNCESLGSESNNKLLGNFGVASTFSTFVGHHLSTIEGGVICTEDEELHEMILQVRAHGWDRNLPIKSQKRLRDKHGIIDDFYSWYSFYDLAYNARPTEINGFIGVIQLEYWDEIVSNRKNNFNKFLNAALDNDDIISLDVEHMNIVSNFAMPLILKTVELYEKYKKRFQNSSVEIRPIIAGNITKQPFYKKYIKEISECPNADMVHRHGFYFGNNPEMTDKEIDVLCGLISN